MADGGGGGQNLSWGGGLTSGAGRKEERNQDATVYVGNIDGQVEESLLWEMMLQAGPVREFCGIFFFASRF
jgi:transketolase N-terminal domain/subunit